MESPAFKAVSMVLIKASKLRPASALLKLPCSAIALMSYDLFMKRFLKLKRIG